MSTTSQILVAVGIGGAGTAAAITAGPAGAGLGRRATLVGGAVVAGASAAATLGAGWYHQDRFAMAHAAYLAITVSLPMLAVGLLGWSWRRGAATWVRPALAVLLLPVPVGIYATHVEPHWLRVDHLEASVDRRRAGDDAVTVGVIGDLQTSGVGDHERRAVREVMAAAPDVILLPGDLFQGRRSDRDTEELRALLGELRAPGGVYFVQGDCEGGGGYHELLAGLDITILDDEVVETRVGDRTLRIGGTRLRYGTPTADAVRAELLATPDDGALTILLSHRPDTVLRLPDDSRIDLTVAGHTHGGQIVAPFVGPLMTLSDVPRDIARGGLGRLDGNAIYVSPGVGLERGHAPQVRLGNRPAVAILTLADDPAPTA